MAEPLNINDLREGCLMCLHYFGIFKYPLTEDQLHQFNPITASPEEIKNTMADLVTERKAFHIQGFYQIKDDIEWITFRNDGEFRAKKLLKRSSRYVNIIASFPFVRGIAISGSLSKFYASEKPDIDYFIITAKNRLWIARTVLHLFKKITFISGHEHYFCMNYFIDTESIEIEHPNLYSAIEAKTLLPVYNKELLKLFSQQNNWTNKYLPNHPGAINYKYLLSKRKRPLKAVGEFFFNLLFPDSLNRSLMKVTDNKWRRKWNRSGYDMLEYDRAFRTGIHISKNHPTDYQKKVLESLPNNLKKNARK